MQLSKLAKEFKHIIQRKTDKHTPDQEDSQFHKTFLVIYQKQKENQQQWYTIP